jgi:hypothetical protein
MVENSSLMDQEKAFCSVPPSLTLGNMVCQDNILVDFSGSVEQTGTVSKNSLSFASGFPIVSTYPAELCKLRMLFLIRGIAQWRHRATSSKVFFKSLG